MTSQSEVLTWFTRHFPVHAKLYGITAVLAVAIMMVLDAWWLYWPLIAWTILFAVHFFIFKSQKVSSEWIEERVARTNDKAYDISHIEDLRERYQSAFQHAADDGVTEAAEAKPEKEGSTGS